MHVQQFENLKEIPILVETLRSRNITTKNILKQQCSLKNNTPLYAKMVPVNDERTAKTSIGVNPEEAKPRGVLPALLGEDKDWFAGGVTGSKSSTFMIILSPLSQCPETPLMK